MKKLVFKLFKILGYNIRSISKENKYLREQKWSFLKNIKIKTIIDIGANEGQFINEVFHIFPEAAFYAFEPLNDCYEKLVSNFYGNKRIHFYNLAIGEQNDEIIFQRSSASPSSSILKMGDLHKKLYPHTANLIEEKIEVKRLDDVLFNERMQDYILLKIDVQGAEDRVIKGSIEILKRVSIIITEVSYASLYENQPLFKDILTLLESQNFIYIGNLEQFKNPSTNAPLFADAIFVKKELHDILYKA